jgi:hypothetical protein
MIAKWGCNYSAVSTAAGAGVVITTAPSWLFGVSVYCKTTGATQAVILDATATNTGNVVLGAASTAVAGNTVSVTAPAPIKMNTGIYASMVAGTAASDYITVFYSLA